MKGKRLRVELVVEVRDKSGKLVGRRCKSGDLILNNFKNFIATVLYPLTSDLQKASMVSADGVAQTPHILVAAYYFGRYGPTGVQIAVGTGTTAPARDNYKLEAEVKRGTPSQTVGADYISWAVALILDVAATIAEAGLLTQWYCQDIGTLKWFLNFRDTFTPIDVPAGGTISVTYKLTL